MRITEIILEYLSKSIFFIFYIKLEEVSMANTGRILKIKLDQKHAVFF